MIGYFVIGLIALAMGIGFATIRLGPRIATLSAEKSALEARLIEKESSQGDQVEAMRTLAHQAVQSAREELNQDSVAQMSASARERGIRKIT